MDTYCMASFDTLSAQEKELIEKSSLDVHYKKGDIVCKQGSFASHIMLLKKGLVKVYLEGRPKNLILKIVSENQLIGLPSLFDGNNTFVYSVATYTDVDVSLIDINVFKQILRKNADFTTEIINILNENSVQTYSRFFCLTRKQLHGRIADIILCLSQRIFKRLQFELSLSRNDLAELTGMSTESVIRILKEFKDDKLIELSGKKIEVIDFERLKKISDFG